MTTKKAFFQLLYLVILSLFSECMTLDATRIISNTSNFSVRCVARERTALLKFKGSLNDPSGRLSTWVDEDCCKWEGVGCDNRTGNVVKLDLKSPYDWTMDDEREAATKNLLGGELNPSLLDLKFLNYLDLSLNNFEGIVIPEFMGSFKHLSYLNLSYASFCGMVPPHLGNLSNLRYLNLYSYPRNYSNNGIWVSDLNWLSGLSSLKYLNLGHVNLSLAKSDWPQPINMLPSLSELHLPDCELRYLPQTLPFLNLTSLLVINLQGNMFSSSIPQWVLNISTLTDIDLSNSELIGPIPEVARGDLCNLRRVSLAGNKFEGETINFLDSLSRCSKKSSLQELDLSNNKLSGKLSDSLGDLQILKSLQLSSNSFSGSIPTSIGKLSSLEVLDLFDNSWEGVISEIHFLELENLFFFRVSSSNSSFTFHMSDDWIPSFSQLHMLEIKNGRVGPKFPAWLQTQKHLIYLSLANADISDTIPDWLWTFSSYALQFLDLSGNQLRGMLPNTVNLDGAQVMLDSNYLEGPLPLWPNLRALSLRNNRFSGQIFEIGPEMQTLSFLDLSGNNLIGSIPTSISKLKNLTDLDLSNNHLSGNIPRHWEGMNELENLDLSNNNLSGDIPSSICSLPSLEWLKLDSNNLSGELSPSIRNCTGLKTLDLGENKFFGNLPKWMGESLSILSVLRLRDNMFSGIIPRQLCSLSYLHVLELADNNLSGSIPPCLGNMTSFQSHNQYSWVLQDMELVMKGSELVYRSTLYLVNLIDLSNNNLRGEIPREITNLSALGTLNLSRNQLTGKIPQKIGALQQLETLDLSSNHLSGSIPPSMTSITSLSYLNLSHNNLSGQIPSANQFHTWIDPSIYEGNLLCGPPLPTPCSTSSNGNNTGDDEDEDEDRSYKLGLFVSVALGFIMGFWLVCGSLVIKKSWRDAYFRFLNEMKDRVYVFVVVNVARLRRKMKF